MRSKLTLLINVLTSALMASASIIGLPERASSSSGETEKRIKGGEERPRTPGAGADLFDEPGLNELERLIESGSFKSAREKLQRLVVEKPNDVNVRLLAGRLYRKMGLWSLSLVEYENARRLNPHVVEPYIALSEMHLENLSVEFALAMAREAVYLAPDSVRAHQALISALIANHNLREADLELKRLMMAFPDDPEVLYLAYKINREMGELQIAQRDLEAAMKRKPDNVTWLLDLADVCEANGEYAEARAALEKYLQFAPDSVAALAKEAEILEFRLYDLDGAKKVYTRILEIEPDNQTALVGNERIFKKRNDIAAAIKRFVYRMIGFIASLFTKKQSV